MGAGRPEQPPKLGEGYVIRDEAWFDEWVAFGFAELLVSLAKHAAFDAWYAAREDEVFGDVQVERSSEERAGHAALPVVPEGDEVPPGRADAA